MPPQYFNENRYSYLVAAWHNPINTDYESKSPVTSFERRVHRMFLEGQRHFHHEEFRLALDTFRELQSLILKTVNPKMPVNPHRIPGFKFPMDVEMVTTLAAKAGTILRESPVTEHQFPLEVIGDPSRLSPAIEEKLKPAIESEMHITSFHGAVLDNVEKGLAAAEKEDWKKALSHYQTALESTPEAEFSTRASLMHDMAILNEKLNQKDQAEANLKESAGLFSRARVPDAQVHALGSLSGLLTRAGKKEEAAQITKQAETVHNKNNLFPVVVNVPSRLQPVTSVTSLQPGNLTSVVSPFRPGGPGGMIGGVGGLTPRASVSPDGTAFMGLEYMPKKAETKTITVQGKDQSLSLVVDANAERNVSTFLQSLSDIDSVEILTAFWRTPVQMVAYLPHMYFFIIPMAIGDCLEGMGNLTEAEEAYLSVLPYPFINRKYEIVRWWTRMAELYLEMGDQAYRRAKDNEAQWQTAKTHYEKIVRQDGTIDSNSPLYKDGKLSSIRTRITQFLQAPNVLNFNDNPRLLTKVLRARVKINQIQAGLNYFGFGIDYFPPFSFEYLQNTARYFAQNAAQIEQQYIQYKSTAENEEFRREQLDQQAEVARQTVILEQRGLSEAQAGVAVAQASVNYAETQRQNAVKAKQDFNDVRWELLELAEAEAWASAASVDQDDEVKQTWNGNYYSSKKKRRSLVLQDLAYRRTRISHDLEANKLQREIDAAAAYKGIAEAQVTQAQARVAVAQQRIQIAKLQQKHAEENGEFLDMKEFSAHLWYELAREARRMSRRYLEMAIEVGMLMERAYNAETERGLNIIRFDYGNARTSDLLAADRLRLDIDHFTLDYTTTIKPKKSPVKKTISLADRFPMAFQQFKTTGECFFQTELEDFDREHSGLYLCKLRNVELVFVGITGATSIAGSLRNIGLSKFRRENGSIVSRHYPSDVLPLSQYDLRNDALAFRVSPNDLRLFENNGIETMWHLELPLHSNDFDFNEILDVHLVMYYDGFFSTTLETSVKAALPGSGSGSRAFPMRLMFPDELFYLKNKGDAELVFDAGMFPRNQTNLSRTDVILKVTGDSSAVDGLTLRLSSVDLGDELVLKTDQNGEVNDATPGTPLRELRNRPVFDQWTLTVSGEDNPNLVVDDRLNLSGIQDITVFFEYSFDYR